MNANFTLENSTHILLIEDDLADAHLIQDSIRSVRPGIFQITHVQLLAEAAEALSQKSFSLILLDLSLPDGQGLETLTEVYRLAPTIPIVILTGTDDGAIAIKAVKSGVQDYLIKGQAKGEMMVQAMQYAVERQHLRATMVEQSKFLQAQTIFTQAILNSLSAHIAVLNKDGIIINTNEHWHKFGINNGQATDNSSIGENYLDVCRKAMDQYPTEMAECIQGLQAILNGQIDHFEFEYPCHSPHEQRWFVMQAVPLQSKAGGLVMSHFNVTTQKLAQQKIEALTEALAKRNKDYYAAHSQTSDQMTANYTLDAETRQSLQADYYALVSHYVKAVRTQEERPLAELQALSKKLADLHIKAKDLVGIHLSVLAQFTREMTPSRERIFANDARLVLVELMGNLMDTYSDMKQGENL